LGRARACIAVGIVALGLPSLAAAELKQVPSAHAVITLGPDGVLDVLENATLQADEPTATTWQVTMQRGELFAQPSLVVDGRRYRAGDGKRGGTFHISRGTRGVRFDWLQPGGSHSVRLAYRLALAGTAYADVVDLRVPAWERDWATPVRDLTGVLKLPRTPKGRVIVWIEPQSLESSVARAGNQIRLRARNVQAGSPVTLHTVLPRSVLTSVDGVNVAAKPGLDSILASRRAKHQPWWPWALATAAVFIAAGLLTLRTVRSRPQRRR
jgi:Predicted membrane protein (DUF2207)